MPIAGKRNSDADGWIVSREHKSAFEQTVIKFVDVQTIAGFAEQNHAGLRNGRVGKTIILDAHFKIYRRNVVAKIALVH